MKLRIIIGLALAALLGLGCGGTGSDGNSTSVPKVGRACQNRGDVAGHGGTVYHCQPDSNGRLVWKKG